MTRHSLALVPDLNLQRHQLHQHTLTASKRRRIPVRSCTHTALLVHHSEAPFLELESWSRQRQQVLTFPLHPYPDLILLARNLTPRLLTAAPQQVVVQLFPVRELRNRHPVVSTKVANLAFNAAFLVPTTRIAKLRFESPVRAKRDEPFCLITLVAPKDLPHRQRQVVIPQPVKHPTEKLERLLLRLEESLLGRTGVASMQRPSACHATDNQHVDLLLLSCDPGISLVPVHLAFTTPFVALRNEYLVVFESELSPPTTDVATNRRLRHLVARILLEHTPPDSMRRVTLFPRRTLVLFQDPVDVALQRSQLRPHTFRMLTLRWHRVLQRLTHHPTVYSELRRYSLNRSHSVLVLSSQLFKQSHLGTPFQPTPPSRDYARERLSAPTRVGQIRRSKWAKSD